MKASSFCLAVLLASVYWCLPIALADDAVPTKPWRLHSATKAPAWIQFGVAHRIRVEHLENSVRANSMSDADALSLRTLAHVGVTHGAIIGAVELLDARAFASDSTPLNTTIVNTLEILQAYAGLTRSSTLAAGDLFELRLGRMTMDVGSRRLVARNRFRNTINGFTGIDATWASAAKHVARVFAVVPVTRLPRDADSLATNKIEVDAENTETLFVGAYFSTPLRLLDGQLEIFAFGLHEKDGEYTSRNRRLATPGFRLWRKPTTGHLDYQVEAALQIGISRRTTSADDTQDLDHRAGFARGEVGVTFASPWTPRVIAQYDFASGDGNPGDDVNGRFDTLFGARRFDFGPTGIYGPFSRANLSSPGARVLVTPNPKLDAFAAYRLYWLASARDGWTSAGVDDATGASGRFLGSQVEARVRWHVLPENLALEVGAAHFIRAGFAKQAPGTREEPATLLYTQITGTI